MLWSLLALGLIERRAVVISLFIMKTSGSGDANTQPCRVIDSFIRVSCTFVRALQACQGRPDEFRVPHIGLCVCGCCGGVCLRPVCVCLRPVPVCVCLRSVPVYTLLYCRCGSSVLTPCCTLSSGAGLTCCSSPPWTPTPWARSLAASW